MKNIKKIGAAFIIFSCALAAFYFLWLSPRYVVPVLTYHRFGYEKNSLYVTPENFRRQMEYLKKKGYNVVSVDEVVQGIKDNRKFARNTVAITVDDGYKDNYTRGFPVMKEYGFPVTIFVVSDFVDQNEDFLSTDEMLRMQRSGVSFGGHTRTHAYLPEVEDEGELWNEIAGCKKTLEEKLNNPVYYYCYPTGGFTPQVKKMVEEAGYRGAFTTNRGLVDFNKDIFELKRIKVTNSDTNRPFNFFVKLSGYYNLFKSKKKGF